MFPFRIWFTFQKHVIFANKWIYFSSQRILIRNFILLKYILFSFIEHIFFLPQEYSLRTWSRYYFFLKWAQFLFTPIIPIWPIKNWSLSKDISLKWAKSIFLSQKTNKELKHFIISNISSPFRIRFDIQKISYFFPKTIHKEFDTFRRYYIFLK